MIKFFRKIRQNSIKENKFSNYLKYAIGEIILVVIGILIALGINNWNIKRKDYNSETAILINLKEEFQLNLEMINHYLEGDYEIVNGCVDITDLIRSNNLEKESHKLDSLLYIIENFAAFPAKTGEVDELINSGKLNIITNDSLRIKLTGWSSFLMNAKEDSEYRFENYHLNLMPFLIKNFPLANGELNKNMTNAITGELLPNYKEQSQFKADYSAINLMEFENIIWHQKHNTDYVIVENYKLKKEILSILKIIESELENK